MAWHSKWHNIKHKKMAADSKRWKVFSLHSKLIALAAQWWWDPDLNPALAEAISKAKADNVPNDNISRAIKKWTWEDKDGIQINEITYEGYAPWWVALIVKTLTDNKNRTASNIRHIFSKYWWNLWESWAVSWMFHKKWVVIISLEKYDFESLEELIFETKAEDFAKEWNIFKIICNISDLSEVKEFFKEKEIDLEFADFDYISENQTDVWEYEKALKITKMLESFDEDEDVEQVYHNWEISEDLQSEVDSAIEKSRFKT